MKKFLSLLLVLCLSLSLAACGATNHDLGLDTDPDQQTDRSQDLNDEDEKKSDEKKSDEESDPVDTDDRGIPGMDSFVIKTLLTRDPFLIPAAENHPADPNNDTCAETCSSSGTGSFYKVSYDYSLSLDGDGEIVSASFGLTNIEETQQGLLLAADLFFSAIGMMKYDTADPDTLAQWFSENLKNASKDPMTTTVGDATYELYGIPGGAYWVHISKTAE